MADSTGNILCQDIEDPIATTSSAKSKADDLIITIRNQIRLIKQMRNLEDAPVDTMGCHMLADEMATPETYRFQTLVALMLSSQTKDQVTAAAMERLKAHGCTIDEIIKTPIELMEDLIKPKKSNYIKQTATILKQDHNNDIPNTLDGLCSLPGVGMKMAHLALKIAFGKTEGIGVDTHVHRITNRLGWVKTTTPEKTEGDLQKILPKEMWNMINKLLVGFGQQMCLPVKPKCDECLLGQTNICPFYRNANNSKRKKNQK